MSPYAVKLATRHLLSHPGQTALLMAGVALGVSVFIFMSALIGGLATLLTLRTVGSIPHIVLEMPDRDPAVLSANPGAQVVLQKDLSRRDQIAIWQPVVPIIEQAAGVIAVSPQIRGSAFVERGQAVSPVGVIGTMPGKLSDIADINAAIIDGSSRLPADGILIGSILARDLGLRVGQVVQLTSDRGRSRSFRISSISSADGFLHFFFFLFLDFVGSCGEGTGTGTGTGKGKGDGTVTPRRRIASSTLMFSSIGAAGAGARAVGGGGARGRTSRKMLRNMSAILSHPKRAVMDLRPISPCWVSVARSL